MSNEKITNINNAKQKEEIKDLPLNMQHEISCHEDILKVIDKHSKKISLVSALGILELVKEELKLQARNNK